MLGWLFDLGFGERHILLSAQFYVQLTSWGTAAPSISPVLVTLTEATY